jgi:glycosyltransferase involved in cell wall biosynthesis
MIDVIIPAYNCKKELWRVLHSTASQTVAEKVNVIVVDDASDEPLMSSDDLVFWEGCFKSIQCKRLDANSGPGAARAAGQVIGKGKYVTFIDADDTWATAYALEKLSAVMNADRNIDGCFGKFIEETRNENRYWLEHSNDRVWMFGKMYRRSFLEENEILMNDSRSNEDMGFNQLVLACTDNIVFINDPVYYWHFKADSITRKPENEYDFTGLKGYIYNHQWAYDQCEERGLNDLQKRKEAVISAVTMMYLYFVESLETREQAKTQELLGWIQEFFNHCIAEKINEYNFDKSFIMSILNSSDIYKLYLPSITFSDFLNSLYAAYKNPPADTSDGNELTDAESNIESVE